MVTALHPTIALLVVFVVALCAESWFSWRFLRELRTNYEDLWVRSGRRTTWSDLELISAYPTIKYLWKREYVPLSQESEVDFCERHRLPVAISWAAAVASVPAFLVSLLAFGWP